MHLSHLGVTVADRIRQRRRRAGPSEQDLVGSGRRPPEPVVAGQQDLVALGVDRVDPELTAGHLHGPRQAGRKTAGNVFDDMGRQQIVEQFPPGRVGLRERGDRRLAAIGGPNAGDQVVASRIHDAGLGDHLAPLVPEVVGGNRGVVGPGRLRLDLVGNRERAGTRHPGCHQQIRIHLPTRSGGGGRVGHRPERTGQHQRADGGVDRGLIRKQMRIEAGADGVDRHDDLGGLGGRCDDLSGLSALRGRRCVNCAGTSGQPHQRHRQHGAAGSQPAGSPRHASQRIDRQSVGPVTLSALWPGTCCEPDWWHPTRPCAPGRSRA